MSRFHIEITTDGVVLTTKPSSSGWFRELVRGKPSIELANLPRDDEHMIDAFAELRELGERGGVEIDSERIFISHEQLSRLSDNTAVALELPPPVELVLKMEMDGQLGSPSFRLRTEWLDTGQLVVVKRIGAVLETERGRRRLPAPLLRAVLEAEKVTDGPASLAEHWERLATFRNSLEPDAEDPETLPDFAQQCSMNNFLEGLRLRSCASLAIGAGSSDDDFLPLPFVAAKPDMRELEIAESDALLEGAQLTAFHNQFKERGATPAYRLSEGEFLILTPDVMPLAELMAIKQHASVDERRAFVMNPEPFVKEAYREARRGKGGSSYDEAEEVMGAAELEALDDAAVEERLVVTIEYRDRVIGMGRFEAPDLSAYGVGSFLSSWMPERITELIDEIREASDEDLVRFIDLANDAIEAAESDDFANVQIGNSTLPAVAARDVIQAELVKRENEKGELGDQVDTSESDDADLSDVNILITNTNFDEVDWHPPTERRVSSIGDTSVAAVRSTLMEHQVSSLDWAQRAWAYGMPGILNADEQGLGKTLQTLAFMAWLHAKMSEMPIEYRRPFLIVAPTSLLRNWEAEIDLHLYASKFASVTQLYGSKLAVMREAAGGTDVDNGEPRLDLGWLETACAEGRGHNHLLLTTYRTATNYHHSLHRISFSTLVFDEIQNLKNPATIAAAASRSLAADFRIGLTGTPIENKVQDLWAIMDQLSPGSFSSLKDFSAQFGRGDRGSLDLLNQQLLDPYQSRPAIGLRRIKENVASDLPPKHRVLLPAVMSEHQANCYDDARVKLVSSNRGGALKALHHIRSVSAHPGLLADKLADGGLTSVSARLQQIVSALDWIAGRKERALVFVEARKLQYQLAEYFSVRYDLNRVDVINGNTSIPSRQKIVNRFQQHMTHDGGFDVLVLSPRAAGTGLTLTSANHVLHVSRWWNPAVEEQCNDRVHRIGQQRVVTVHLPLAIHPQDVLGSFDCLLQKLMLKKRLLASDVLSPMAESEGDVITLQEGLSTGLDEQLPNFESMNSLVSWAEERLIKFQRQAASGTAKDETKHVTIVLNCDGNKSTTLNGVKSDRRIVLFARGETRLESSRLEDGTLVTELGGEMLLLWPEAVLEPGDRVTFFT